MSISDEEYQQMKAKLKTRSKNLFLSGLATLIVSVVMIILSFVFSDFGPLIGLFIPSMFLIFIGFVLLMIGFQLWYATKADKISGYYAKATGDSAKYSTEKVTDGFATGLKKHGMGIGGGSKEVVKIKCQNCGYLETEDAKFCSQCQQPL